jgi:Cu/Ag efflux protein CusF
MTSRFKNLPRFASVCALALCVVPLFAVMTAPTNFSGTFVLQTADTKKASAPVGLKIAQGTKTIEVTDDTAGKVTTNTFKLDETDGPYMTATGFPGICSVKWENKALVLQTLVDAKKGGKVIHFLTKKRMELSADGTTLKVHTEIISPDVPAGLFPPFDSVYKRSKQP